MLRVAHFKFDTPTDSAWSALRFFTGTRLAVAAGLFVSFYTSRHGENAEIQFRHVEALSVVAWYFLAALLIMPLAWYVRRRFYSFLVGQVALDILVLGWLMATSFGLQKGLGLLFLLPIAGAAALSPLLLSLTVAALCSLGILLDVWLRILSGVVTEQNLFFLAGVNGVVFFVTAWLINRVAARLLQQEKLVREREARVQNQLAVNRLIIAEMDDGVVVVDVDGKIQAANPAALHIFQTPQIECLAQQTRWQQVWRVWLERQQSKVSVRLDAPTLFRADAVINFADNVAYAQRVQIRIHATAVTIQEAGASTLPASVVIVIQDLSQVEMRAQQLKLASLGRLSASIAHEIRNPLSAIRHAAALLGEEALSETQRRLTRILEINTQRINRIIEDVLNISRRESVQTQRLPVRRFVQELVQEFTEQIVPQLALAESGSTLSAQRLKMVLTVAENQLIYFDQAHLRRVVFNLLNNAVRYASAAPGSIVVWVGNAHALEALATRESTASTAHRLVSGMVQNELLIVVSNDGPPLTVEQQQHLFEPFFTTDAQGTGLGLFLSRELCEANLASLSYLDKVPWHPQASTAFVIRVSGITV